MLFGVLLLVLVGVAGNLALRELNVKVLSNRLDLIRHEAERIARTVAHLGGDPGSIDFSRVRAGQDALRNVIHERFSRRFFMHHVEIRDRFGVRQMIFFRESVPMPQPELKPGMVPVDWPTGGQQEVRVPLGLSEGEVIVGIAAQPLLSELENLRSSLRLKVVVAAVLAVGVLVAGFFYVLHLLKKNRMLEQARQSAERASYVGLLASGLAHEIRNPLNAMNMNLQMLEEELQCRPDCADLDYHELLGTNQSEIKRLERLVNNFLAYARPARPRFESTDLNQIVSEVARFLEGDFRQSQVELSTELEPMVPHVEIDETQFKQALMNLLVNARQVLPANGRVVVRTRPGSQGEVVLEVEDDGPGIPAEARERIFEVFYSSRGGGTGLGLPIARQIVERHGGTIDLRSEEGKGTTFMIRLPRRHPAHAASND
ncbi:MAG: hypothetical protein GY716_20265 [bacterium]|nr:hypothetical protein [bacterium]